MNKKGGGPFMALINARINAIEFAYQRGDFAHAISALKGLGKILGVNLPESPRYNPNFIVGHSVSLKQKAWVDTHSPLIDAGVAEWMKRNNRRGLAPRVVEAERTKIVEAQLRGNQFRKLGKLALDCCAR